MGNNIYWNRWNKNKLASLFLTVFFLVSFIEIAAEYNEDEMLIWLTKPLIMPLLMAYYMRRSHKINTFFVVALFFCWIANIFFIKDQWSYIIIGVCFFLVYRILTIGIVLKKIQMPSLLPMIIGCLPFIFIYAFATIFTFNRLGDCLFLFLAQGIFTVFLGGLSLSNYILISNKTNRIFLISALCFALNQFTFLLRFYYDNSNLIQAISMVLFISGQFLLIKYILKTEKQKNRYLIVNNLSEVE